MNAPPIIESVVDAPPDRALCERIGAILERGGLVGLPTETVYGIGARADSAPARAALAELKDRPADRALTWHVGSVKALERFPTVSPMARRLVARYWPGPLTLVLPGVPRGLEGSVDGEWTGVRLPAHRATAGILEHVDFPVVLTSANRHGAEPLCSAADVEAAFGSKLAAIVDGGPSRLKEASSVLRIGPGAFELLRAGLFTLEQLRAVAGLKIGFVCTGNTCRSPMAEVIAKKLLAERLAVPVTRIGEFGFDVTSMGVSASAGAPAARHAIQILKESGMDLSRHRSRPAVTTDIERLDRVYCMARPHLDALTLALPPGRNKNLEMLDPAGADIADPIGGAKEDYRRAAAQIEAGIRARLEDWA